MTMTTAMKVIMMTTTMTMKLMITKDLKDDIDDWTKRDIDKDDSVFASPNLSFSRHVDWPNGFFHKETVSCL